MFSADVEPIASGFIVLAASRIARQARRRTAGGTSVPEISSRRVAIASEARERTSAQPPLRTNPKPLCHFYFSSEQTICRETYTVACFRRETRYSRSQNGSADEVEIVNVTSIDMSPYASRLTRRCFLSPLFKSPCPYRAPPPSCHQFLDEPSI